MIEIVVALLLLFVIFLIFSYGFSKKILELKEEIDNLNINNNTDEKNTEETCDKCEIVEQFCIFLNESLTKLEDGKVDDVKTDIKNILTLMENSEKEE